MLFRSLVKDNKQWSILYVPEPIGIVIRLYPSVVAVTCTVKSLSDDLSAETAGKVTDPAITIGLLP